MSPSPGLAPGLGAVTLRTLHRQIRPQRGRPDNGSGRASHHLAETGISLWPDHERILSEYKRASCLKPASDSLRRPNCAKKHASLPLLQCWPKSCTGSPRQKVGRQQQDGSCAWSSICQSTMRLPHPRSTVCTPLGEAEDALACHRSCRRKPVFRRWPAYLHLRAAILRWRAISVGSGDRQPCPGRSKHSSDGVARYPRGRGTACWRSLQALIHNAGILPPGPTPQTSLTGSVESGMRLLRLNLLGMILLPQGLFLELKTTSVSIVNVT